MPIDGERFTVVDLFAGAGGLSEGFRIADSRFRTLCAVEIDRDAAATFAANHGDVVFPGPIESWLETGEVPSADVVIGGPPCQGFSTLGKQSEGDKRNSLWQEYAEALLISRPAYFVLENVPAFLKSKEFSDFEEMIHTGRLSDYEIVADDVLNAAEFGVPQIRRRAIVIGKLKDAATPSLDFEEMLQRSDWRTVRDAIGDLPEAVHETELPKRSAPFRGATVRGPFTSPEIHVSRQYRRLSLDRFEAIPAGGNRFDLPESLQAPCWIKHRTGSADVMGRLRWDEPSVTIRTEFFKPEKGRYIHPTQHRAITHLEAARLQGFPDSYRWCGSKTSIARQIGNAVPVQLGRALGKAIAEALDVTSARARHGISNKVA